MDLLFFGYLYLYLYGSYILLMRALLGGCINGSVLTLLPAMLQQGGRAQGPAAARAAAASWRPKLGLHSNWALLERLHRRGSTDI